MFYVILLQLVGFMLWVLFTQGPLSALRWASAVVLLLPTWMVRFEGPLKLDLRTVVCLLVVAGMALHPKTRLRGRWVLADFIVLALVAAQTASEFLANDIRPSVMLLAAFQWILPYALGRLALQAVGDIKELTRLATNVCLTLSIMAAVESVTKLNVVNYTLGRTGSIQGEHDVRWGLKRAEGPLPHPILFGMMLVLILPWTLHASSEAARGDGPAWWKALPWIAAVGIFFTMSRGPQIAMGICLFTTALFRMPKFRKPLLAVAALAAVVIGLGQDEVLRTLHVWSNEAGKEKTYVTIKGKDYEYSGTNHRFLLFQVYGDAMWEAGWFGYGSERVMATPMRIPHVEEQLMETFYSIDNHYIHLLLRCGFLGVSLFVCLGLCGLAYLFRPAMALHSPNATLAAALFGANLGVMLLLFTVWFAFDFGFVWLFSIGLAGSWRWCVDAAELSADTEPSDPVVEHAVPRRLSPGHPRWALS